MNFRLLFNEFLPVLKRCGIFWASLCCGRVSSKRGGSLVKFLVIFNRFSKLFKCDSQWSHSENFLLLICKWCLSIFGGKFYSWHSFWGFVNTQLWGTKIPLIMKILYSTMKNFKKRTELKFLPSYCSLPCPLLERLLYKSEMYKVIFIQFTSEWHSSFL